jgi:anti-sigma B factor antagonist
VRRIILSGRLDFHGVEEIVGQLSSLLASTGTNALIDLTRANLICSMGIRALILNAKNMQQRGARMALLVDDGTIVSSTLKSVGIDSLLPIFTSLPEAKKSLLQ